MTGIQSNKIDIFISNSEVVCIESTDKKIVTLLQGESLVDLKSRFNSYYETVNIYYVSPSFTILPEELYNPDKKREILEFTTKIKEVNSIRSSVLLPFNTYVIWSIPSQLETQVTSLLPNAIFHHISEKGIQTLFGSKNDFVTLEISNHILNAIKENGELQQITVNKAKTINDKVYFSLLPFQNQNTNELQTFFIGSEDLAGQLKKYIQLEPYDNKNNYTSLLK